MTPALKSTKQYGEMYAMTEQEFLNYPTSSEEEEEVKKVVEGKEQKKQQKIPQRRTYESEEEPSDHDPHSDPESDPRSDTNPYEYKPKDASKLNLQKTTAHTVME